VAQRGTSVTGATIYSYNTADRARLSKSGASGVVVDQEIVDDQDVGDFVAKALKTTVTTVSSNAGTTGYNYRVEDLDIQYLKDKTVTLSWYAKADQAVDVLTFASCNSVSFFSETISYSTSWKRYTKTFTVSEVGGFMDIGLRQDAEVATSTYTTGVQLELGSVATPFEHRSYGEELQLCFRYFYSTMFLRSANSLTAPTNNAPQIFGARHRFADVTGYRSQDVQHPVPMRASPSITFYNPGNSGTSGQFELYSHDGNSQNFSGFITVNRETSFIFAGYTGVSVGTGGYSTVCFAHWKADAEL